jgi:hypothetical protein
LGVFAVVNCGDGNVAPPADNNDVVENNNTNDSSDENGIYGYNHNGLYFYYKNMVPSEYKLDQLSNAGFNALSQSKKMLVANKLLSTLFFGYTLNDLKTKIADGSFIDSVRNSLDVDKTDKAWLEEYILDDSVFRQYDNRWYTPQAITILRRFYAMKDLDKYFLHNWIAYVLTQTIMFSPAYELLTTHTPNVAGVYNRLVSMLEDEKGMRFITYVHMMSEDNWRRFRSPEDNGREMLEIYLLDTMDSHVPLAGQALKNWKLNTDSDTLEIGLNQNTSELKVLTKYFGGGEVITGEDYYRELVKSKRFTSGVVKRLVDFFFPEKSAAKRSTITNTIVLSKPETWQDILLQIVFSEEYLLHNSRAQSAEETFYSLAKKIHYRHHRGTFGELKTKLEEMHQATMKYKLGKLERVPLDSLSFAHYHKFIRERVLLKYTTQRYDNDNDSWGHDGWQPSFIAAYYFSFDEHDHAKSLKNFVNYIFESTIGRVADNKEQALFKGHMLETEDGHLQFKGSFDIFATHNDSSRQSEIREDNRRNIALLVLDYISRSDATYRQREVR